MNTEELKKLTIEKIKKLDDKNSIEQINNLLDFESESGIYTLTDEQIVRVEEAKDEYKNSSIISEKVANQEIEKWLNEK
ncbi:MULTISPECIES: hypothetical protein [Empedobacter]|uniref:hypothetical protein n=1 Tax=Empedobacter TaxID=59734 RepID=UPI00244BB93E|nr:MULTISPECIES: hypothetical protein [Empedobacter]MDH0660298.1 hypothetical protein [Empedobacter sp. GD03865]MDH0675006.1 hypothetical protein [Empedobacter sp. GD03861]MDH1883896.1 hypothetical protein [Empedobacter sp. GD03797]MDM1042548.1 hypothetical protein [Empedobacter brevis]MDM1136478.1 hypothetical protein [Empedobacter sp. R750]